MKIKAATVVKYIEFTSKSAETRYFEDLAVAGKGFRCLKEGKYKDIKGKTKYFVIVEESCGYPMLIGITLENNVRFKDEVAE